MVDSAICFQWTWLHLRPQRQRGVCILLFCTTLAERTSTPTADTTMYSGIPWELHIHLRSFRGKVQRSPFISSLPLDSLPWVFLQVSAFSLSVIWIANIWCSTTNRPWKGRWGEKNIPWHMRFTACFLGFPNQSLVTHHRLVLISTCEFKSDMTWKLRKGHLYAFLCGII